MTVEDVAISLNAICFIIGILSLFFAYADTTAISQLSHAINQTGLPQMPSVQALSSNLYNFSFFFPDLAILMVVVMITQSFILDFFIKSHPLAAVSGVLTLFGYTIISFFVSNAFITVARLSIFSGVISFANPLLFIMINAPVITLICGCVSIALCLTAARQ